MTSQSLFEPMMIPTSGPSSTSRSANSSSTSTSVSGVTASRSPVTRPPSPRRARRCRAASACRRTGSSPRHRTRGPGPPPGEGPIPVTFSTRPPAVTNLPSGLGGAGVEDLGVEAVDRAQPVDLVALRRRLGVPARGEHDRHGPVGRPLGRRAVQPAEARRAVEQVEQVRPQPREHGLRLRVAEAAVELEHLRARRR